MSQSITILPETDDRTLCVHITGVLNADDFEKSFITPVKTLIAGHGEFNLYAFYSDDYQGWDPSAADSSFKTYSELGPFGRRCAYVNAPDSRHLILKMMRPLMPDADIRFFDSDEAGKALAWAKGTP
jgi:hypothetical protein